MYLDSESIRQTQRSMGRMPQTVYYSDHRMTLCWMRLIKGQLESLLTTCTKHTVYEIEYALRGSLTLQVDDAQVCIDEGQFLVIPPETSHQIIESKGDGIKFIVGFSSGSKALQINPHEPIPETPAIRGIVEIMTGALNSGSKELQSSLMQSALFAFIDAIPPGFSPSNTQMDREQCVRRFMDFVESSNGVGISVQEGARLISLSERQLFRNCLSVTGNTPSQIIQKARAAYIRSCLTETRMSLSEIAELAGFQTEYAMAKFFRKSEGMLPSAYRAKVSLQRNDAAARP